MAGVPDRLFDALQEHYMIRVSVDCLGLDSTSIQVHPPLVDCDAINCRAMDGTGAPKKSGPQAIGKSRWGWNTKSI